MAKLGPQTRALARKCASQWLDYHEINHTVLPDDKKRGYDILVADHHGEMTVRIAVEGRQSPTTADGQRLGNNNSFELNQREPFYWCLWILFAYEYDTYTPYLLPRHEAIKISHPVTHDEKTDTKRDRVFFRDLVGWEDNNKFALNPGFTERSAKYPVNLRSRLFDLTDGMIDLD